MSLFREVAGEAINAGGCSARLSGTLSLAVMQRPIEVSPEPTMATDYQRLYVTLTPCTKAGFAFGSDRGQLSLSTIHLVRTDVCLTPDGPCWRTSTDELNT
jgi:hypothetical protein